MLRQEFAPEKLKALFHYVIKAAGAQPNFGAVKLNKVAWFSDAKTFLLTGRSITGETYIRKEFGPVPKHGDLIREQLVREGAITQSRSNREYESWRFRSNNSPNVSVFDEQELQTINYWVRHIDEDHTADSISEESHDYGWEIAGMYEELPLHSFLASRIREPSSEEKSRLLSRAKELGLA